MTRAKIMLVDDHPLLRKGLAQLIALEDHLEIVCEASSGEEAITLAQQYSPDLVLLDLGMKGMSGLETLRELRKLNIPSKIVIFTVSDNEIDVLQALKFGADGFLLKDSEPEEVVIQITKALNGELVLSSPLNQVIARSLQSTTAAPSLFEKLSKREVDILRGITHGDSNKMIGNELGITEATVKVHVKSLLKKLSLRTRVEAAVWAVKNKIAL